MKCLRQRKWHSLIYIWKDLVGCREGILGYINRSRDEGFKDIQVFQVGDPDGWTGLGNNEGSEKVTSGLYLEGTDHRIYL